LFNDPQKLEATLKALAAKAPRPVLMLAEIARELGEFYVALRLLSPGFPAGYECTAAAIQEGAEQEDTHVRPIYTFQFTDAITCIPAPRWYSGPDRWKDNFLRGQDIAVRALLAAGYGSPVAWADLNDKTETRMFVLMSKKDAPDAYVDPLGTVNDLPLRDFLKKTDASNRNTQ
jgi:hypothetical protein